MPVLHHFLMMGGYAPYVWSAYGITLGILIINIYLSSRRHSKTKKVLKAECRL